MTPGLAERLRAHKIELLRLLSAGDTTTTRHAKPATFEDTERRILLDAGLDVTLLPLTTSVKQTFADLGGGVTVCGVKRDPACCPRRQAANLIRQAHRTGDRSRAVMLRDAWDERIAICTIDGGLSEAEAARIALAELERMN